MNITSETKHTPGPWVLTRDDFGFFSVSSEAATPHKEPVAPHVYDWDDARLIAAAPDMLEALKACLVTFEALASNAFHEGLEGTSEWDRIAGAADLHGRTDSVRAAIAKATQTV